MTLLDVFRKEFANRSISNDRFQRQGVAEATQLCLNVNNPPTKDKTLAWIESYAQRYAERRQGTLEEGKDIAASYLLLAIKLAPFIQFIPLVKAMGSGKEAVK